MRGFVDKADGTLCLNELVGLLVETDDFRTSSTSCDCHSESDKVRIRIWKCRFPYERILEATLCYSICCFGVISILASYILANQANFKALLHSRKLSSEGNTYKRYNVYMIVSMVTIYTTNVYDLYFMKKHFAHKESITKRVRWGREEGGHQFNMCINVF